MSDTHAMICLMVGVILWASYYLSRLIGLIKQPPQFYRNTPMRYVEGDTPAEIVDQLLYSVRRL